MALLARFLLGLELASGWRRVLLPITSGEYWFVTVYIALYFLMPYLKLLVDQLSSKMHLRLLITGFVFFSFIPTFLNEEWLNFGGAYGIAWFVYLYLKGAYIRANREKIENLSGRFGKKRWLFCLVILKLKM